MSPVTTENAASVNSDSRSADVSIIAPSFGEMGEAIERLISELAAYRIDDNDGDARDGGGDMMMTISEEHQLILACCWLNLKVRKC